jgi:large subunit ribosomal protein L15
MAIKMIAPPEGAVRKRKRLGRGNGSRGNTSGRGYNGQNSRSGGGVRPGFEGGQMPIYRRLPRRGFSNADFKVTFEPVNLSTLEKVYKDGEEVNLETLKAKKLIKNRVENVKNLK